MNISLAEEGSEASGTMTSSLENADGNGSSLFAMKPFAESVSEAGTASIPVIQWWLWPC